ncbi:MAG: protein-disulfide reductase DsbD N-terminal domain-containing protein [Comamonas sp.]|nr:protein-disulfide reductase DsbD N-terminal domain-containing protein [Comamonas sp.]
MDYGRRQCDDSSEAAVSLVAAQRNSLELLEQPSGVSIKNIALPSGNSKQDPTFGTMDVYYGTVRINIFLDPATVKRGIAVKLHVTYQGCNDSKGGVLSTSGNRSGPGFLSKQIRLLHGPRCCRIPHACAGTCVCELC